MYLPRENERKVNFSKHEVSPKKFRDGSFVDHNWNEQ